MMWEFLEWLERVKDDVRTFREGLILSWHLSSAALNAKVKAAGTAFEGFWGGLTQAERGECQNLIRGDTMRCHADRRKLIGYGSDTK